jgi:hypothetical protein
MPTEQHVDQGRAHLAKLVLDLGEERALKWLEEKLWIASEDEYGGDDLPALITEELDLVPDEQVEEFIDELEGS